MSADCAELDPFFDGELSKEEAVRFREHLATCERCQAALRGRMQEEVVAGMRHERVEQPRVVAVMPAHRDARPRRIATLAPLLAAAAAVVIWLVVIRDPERPGESRRVNPHGGEVSLAQSQQGSVKVSSPMRASNEGAGKPIEASLTIKHQGQPKLGTAAVGDVLRLMVHGERYQAIWVYLDDRELVITCPDSTKCSSSNGRLTLEFEVSAPGRYSIVSLTSAEPIVVPHGPLGVMLTVATNPGTYVKIEHVYVN